MAQIIGNRAVLSITEACERYNLSHSYLGLLARKKYTEAIKISLVWLIYEDSLQAFLSHPRKTGPKPKSIQTS